jgi:hypothetical protein
MRRKPGNILDTLTGAQAPEVGQLGDLAGGGAGLDQMQGVGLDSSQLSDDDLAGMAEGGDAVGYEDLQLQQMEAALNDPSTPPEQRAMLEQQLALAARRRMAGV